MQQRVSKKKNVNICFVIVVNRFFSPFHIPENEEKKTKGRETDTHRKVQKKRETLKK